MKQSILQKKINLQIILSSGKMMLERLKRVNEFIYLFLGMLLITYGILNNDTNYIILGAISFLFVRLTEITRRQLK